MSTIWIDLENTPHVPFFVPLIRHFNREEHKTLVTVRDYGFTREMMAQQGIPFELIGRHPGKNIFLKAMGILVRVANLVRWAGGKRIDVGVSHGSRSLVLACAVLRIPCVTMYDYEFVSTSIFNRLSSKVLLPELFPNELLGSLGLGGGRVAKYPGLKEEVYLGDFRPDAGIFEQIGVSPDQVIVVLRPPATTAHYHNPRSERIMQVIMDRISGEDGVIGVVTPRTAAQAHSIARNVRDPKSFRVLEKPVHGLNLIAHSDLVVGGGGTMNREAALMGVPVYSVFTGEVGTIDRKLSEDGRLVLVRDIEDVARIRFEKRTTQEFANLVTQWTSRSGKLTEFICDEVLKLTRR